MHENDASLLAAAQRERAKGRHEAFEQLLKRYEKLVYYITRRYFNNPEDAQDASQEAIIKIYKGLAGVKINENGSLKSWICTVTAHVCLDELRRRRITQEPLPENGFPGYMSEPSAEETAAARERANEILNAVAKLPDDHRMVIILRDMNGLSYDELAEALRVNVGTVKSRLSRARAMLKKNISDYIQ